MPPLNNKFKQTYSCYSRQERMIFLSGVRLTALFPKNHHEVYKWLEEMVGKGNWFIKGEYPGNGRYTLNISDPHVETMFYIKFGNTMKIKALI